ncbi:hypothetical protein WG66_007899 [Moniliophthora roreri]|nr:hypothetical protein WG66_007899 [Moniliophthora roreri]
MVALLILISAPERLAEPEDGTLTSLTIRNSRAAYLCRTPDLRTLKTSTQGNTSGTGRSRTDSMCSQPRGNPPTSFSSTVFHAH